jgi:hypothetical protein
VYLPNRGEDWEYEAVVAGREYVLCNRLLKCQFLVENEDVSPYSYTICHHKHLEGFKKSERKLVYKEPLRTVISTTHRIVTDNPRTVFEENYLEWSGQLLAAGNALIDGARLTGTSEVDYNLNTYSRPLFWVACMTAEVAEGRSLVCYQVMGGTHDAVMAPLTQTDDRRWKSMLAIASDPSMVDEADLALASARTFARYKYLDLAVVQLCVSVESALARSVKTYLSKKGVKGDALKSRFKDVASLFHLLNTHVYLLLDMQNDADLRSAVSALEWARDRRNKVVHGTAEARARIDESRLKEAVSGAATLLVKLRSAGYIPVTNYA